VDADEHYHDTIIILSLLACTLGRRSEYISMNLVEISPVFLQQSCIKRIQKNHKKR
jgi:hypothetical protein